MGITENSGLAGKILHNVNELAELIHEIGFMPLFSNAIRGFSVEEMTEESVWWTGDASTDPWEWRRILAADPEIAYGKFFNKNAGFVSKEFFPVFVNYRRNGYDYDALYEDGLASYRSKKIMDVFRLDDDAVGSELMSPDIKEKAGFVKEDGEKNFSGHITDLQMQTYLITSDFSRRTNRIGQEYGWHIALLETPETKWGYEHIASGYTEDPKTSWQAIVDRVKTAFPEAADKDIQKIMGIRYPGEPSLSQQTAKKKAEPKPKKLRPQQLPWPENLITEIGLEAVFGTKIYTALNEDQLAGLEYALDQLKEKEKTAVILRYKEHKTFKETGDHFSVTPERMRQIIQKCIRKLRNPVRLVYYRDGYQGVIRKREEEKRRIREAAEKNGLMETLNGIDIREAEFSVRTFNCLLSAGLNTLGQVVERMKEDPFEILKIRNLGIKSLEELVNKLEGYGVDCDPIRENAKFFYGENNRVSNPLNSK